MKVQTCERTWSASYFNPSIQGSSPAAFVSMISNSRIAWKHSSYITNISMFIKPILELMSWQLSPPSNKPKFPSLAPILTELCLFVDRFFSSSAGQLTINDSLISKLSLAFVMLVQSNWASSMAEMTVNISVGLVEMSEVFVTQGEFFVVT